MASLIYCVILVPVVVFPRAFGLPTHSHAPTFRIDGFTSPYVHKYNYVVISSVGEIRYELCERRGLRIQDRGCVKILSRVGGYA
jgi:hypothetical protein